MIALQRFHAALRHTLVVLLATLVLLPAARAEQDEPGSSDHPAVARFPGFYIDDYESNDFSAFEFITGLTAGGDEVKADKEGKYWRIVYRLKEGGRVPSVLEVIRNYEAAFKRNGGTMPWSNRDEGRATYRQPVGPSERWVDLEVADQGRRMQLRIVEVGAMKQKVEFSSSEMLDALNKDGFIALTGIQFDTGKETIRAESEPLLREILALLTGTSGLRLSIEGHTDNVGSPATNGPLSKRRADAVRDWLVGKGIAANRLSTQGFGDTRPIADNRTEAGRAKNRRVELVRQK